MTATTSRLVNWTSGDVGLLGSGAVGPAEGLRPITLSRRQQARVALSGA